MLGEESVAKVEHIFQRGYRRVLGGGGGGGGKGHRRCGEEGDWERNSYFE